MNETVSRQMKKMPRSGTRPERMLRSELFRRGLRFRVNYPGLPGRPDIVLTKVRIAVFIDGCFWHGCPIHSTLPKNNRAWWEAKIAGNRERDVRKDAELRANGWLPLHYWEHDEVDEIADEVESVWRDLR